MNKILLGILTILMITLTVAQAYAQVDSRLGVFPVNSEQCSDNSGDEDVKPIDDAKITVVFEESLLHYHGGSAICVPHWVCSDWTACEDGSQTRTCKDLAYCQTIQDMPETKVSCKEEQSQEVLSGLETNDDELLGLIVKENIDDVFENGQIELKDIAETKTSFFDSINLLPFIVLIFVAGLFIFLIVFKRRKSQN